MIAVSEEMVAHKPTLFNEEQLNTRAKLHKLQPFKVKQILFELYKNQNTEREAMTTLSKELRSQLQSDFDLLAIELVEMVEAADTTNFAFKTRDGHLIEAILMYHWQHEKYVQNQTPKLNRITLCISSQVGCAMQCLFCVTGKLGFRKNLTWEEMISQVLFANSYIKKRFWKKEDGTNYSVRNIVFMGMGEPLLNYDHTKIAIKLMLQQDRLSLGRRHVTISTCWIIPGIEQLIKDQIDVKLAISRHAPNQELRNQIMPIGKSYPLDKLMTTIDQYVEATNNRIFYEYIMIKDLTDTPALAHELVQLLQGRLAHINLIPYNENPAIHLQESSKPAIETFIQILESWGLTVTVRDSMGREAKGACGQLGYEKVKGQQSGF